MAYKRGGNVIEEQIAVDNSTVDFRDDTTRLCSDKLRTAGLRLELIFPCLKSLQRLVQFRSSALLTRKQ